MHSNTKTFRFDSGMGTDMSVQSLLFCTNDSGETGDTREDGESLSSSKSQPPPNANADRVDCTETIQPRPRELYSSPSPLVLQPVHVSEGGKEGGSELMIDKEETLHLSPRSAGVVPEHTFSPQSNVIIEPTGIFGDVDLQSAPFEPLDPIPEEIMDEEESPRKEVATSTVNPAPTPLDRMPSDSLTTEYSAEDNAWISSAPPTEQPVSTTEPPSISNSASQPPTQAPSSQISSYQTENELQPDLIPNHLDTEDTGYTSSAASTNGENSSVFDEDYHSETSSYTASLLSDVKDYTYENGRRYHSYREGHYVLPNDEPEQDRQDLLHHVRNLALNGSLFRAPVPKSMQRVLDIGTGTGIWAIDFADSYSAAEVIGTDLSPIQPSWVPPNLRFIADDAESPWLFSTSRPFDFIHARDLGGAIADWPRLLRQAYRHLRPGGWIELQEFEVTLRSDDDSLRLAPTLCEFLGQLHLASEKFHRPMNIAEGHRLRLIEAGFEDVRDEVYKVPSSAWHDDPIQKQIGRYNLCSLLMAVESYSLALFTRVLGWSNHQTQVFLAGVRRDLRNPEVHTYCNLHVVYGRKSWDPQVD